MFLSTFVSFAEVSRESFGAMLVIALIGVVALLAGLWLVRMVFLAGRSLATFMLGLLVAAVLIGWVVPWSATVEAISGITEVALKPYHLAQEGHATSNVSNLRVAVELVGWGALNGVILGGLALLLTARRNIALVAGVLGMVVAGGLFTLGLLI